MPHMPLSGYVTVPSDFWFLTPKFQGLGHIQSHNETEVFASWPAVCVFQLNLTGHSNHKSRSVWELSLRMLQF